jgi:hypothetical protein
MKKIGLIVCSIILLSGCKKENVEVIKVNGNEKFASFGAKITADSALTNEEMLTKYSTLKEGDTINVKFKSDIKDVCQKKGCWMNMNLAKNKESFVRFKDYGFFMPKNAAGNQAIVSGKAFISVESIDELKHYAKDAGKSQIAIDSIIAPETNYSFTANGVLIQQ